MAKPRAHLIINSKSGSGKGSTLTEEFKQLCNELNFEPIEYSIHRPDELEHHSKIAINRALDSDDVVIAAGGDGTIRSVAQEAHGQNVRFAIVPCGTFNFFARAHNIPEDHQSAFRFALTGLPRPVRLGLINGQVFLINASLGLYAKAIKDREHSTRLFGRYQLVVIISTILSFFSKHRLLRV
jgi:diacylglycerol kinase family enzyme